jgi:hypothetical protein
MARWNFSAVNTAAQFAAMSGIAAFQKLTQLRPADLRDVLDRLLAMIDEFPTDRWAYLFAQT